jgi:hypothetical protein
MSDIRHDPAIPEAELPELMEQLRSQGIKIRFRDTELLVDPRALKDAQEYVAGLSHRDRLVVLMSVGMALDKAYPKMMRGNFKKKTADNFYSDVLIFEAFRRSHLN